MGNNPSAKIYKDGTFKSLNEDERSNLKSSCIEYMVHTTDWAAIEDNKWKAKVTDYEKEGSYNGIMTMGESTTDAMRYEIGRCNLSPRDDMLSIYVVAETKPTVDLCLCIILFENNNIDI